MTDFTHTHTHTHTVGQPFSFQVKLKLLFSGMHPSSESYHNETVLSPMAIQAECRFLFKVTVFSRDKVRKLPVFTVGNDKLDVVSSLQYLGIKLNYNNSFNVAQRDLYHRASWAVFALLKKSAVG